MAAPPCAPVTVSRFVVHVYPAHVVARDEEAWLPGFTSLTQDERLRPDSETLLASLGCGTPRALDSAGEDPAALRPTREEAARLTEAAAARVCRMLTHGTLTERFNAVFVLSAHLLLPPEQRAPAFHSATTLDAICVAAVSNAYVPQAADHPLAEPHRREICQEDLARLMRGPMLDLCTPSASEMACGITAFAVLRMMALDTCSCCLMDAVRRSFAEGSAAARRALRLRVAETALLFASGATYAAGGGLNPETARALRVRGRTVAFNALLNLVSVVMRLDPPARDGDALLASARRVALEALDPAANTHPRVRGAACCLLSICVTPPPAKVEALDAGALHWMLDIAEDAATYHLDCRCRGISGAGNMAYATASAARISRFTALLFARIERVAAKPTLLDGGDSAAEEEVQLLYSCTFALGQLAQYADVRPLFNEHMTALWAVAAAASERPQTASIAAIFAQRIMAMLTRLPQVAFSADVSKLHVVTVSDSRAHTHSAGSCMGALGGAPRAGEALFDGSGAREEAAAPGTAACAGCGTQGEGFKCCARCREVRYCGAACQHAHWKTHKPRCNQLVAARDDARLLSATTNEEKLAALAKRDAKAKR